jgi:hypothetical protein
MEVTMRNRVFKKIMLGQVPGADPAEVERYCCEGEKFGATSVIVNVLPDPYHPAIFEDPTHTYVNFATWGPSLDMYVSTDLNRDVYPEAYLARNRATMQRNIEIAERHGMKPVVLMGEPRFQPERFYRRHPHLRGPRVDHPGASLVPLYAPCVDMPQVQQHYRESMVRFLTLFPQVDTLIFYSGDSGTGLCYSNALYPGRNGPRHCQDTPSTVRMYTFVNLLLEAARTVNLDFRILLFEYIHGDEREETLRHTPPAVSGIARGYWVCGSLEDWWGSYEYGMKIDEVGYDRAREGMADLLRQSVAELRSLGKPVSIPTNAPIASWAGGPVRVIPYPYTALRSMEIVRGMEPDEVLFYGVVSDPAIVPYDTNRGVLQRYLNHPEESPDQVIRAVAEEWVGAALAGDLCRTWQLCDKAACERPYWTPYFGLRVEPLVPDPERLTDEERSYYQSGPPSPLSLLPGAHPLSILRRREDSRAWIVRRYWSHALPPLQEAIRTLTGAVERARGEEASVILKTQRVQMAVFMEWLRSQCNWMEAGGYLVPGKGAPRLDRSMIQIINDEIATTERLIQLVEGRVDQVLVTSDATGGRGSRLIQSLKTRIELMKKHREDPIRAITLPPPERGRPGMDDWEGETEDEK